jgi:hypothetical protein
MTVLTPALPGRAGPAFLPVAMIILVYAGVVSVADYLVLRKLRRLPATWITFPAAIVVFSVLVYVYLHGRQSHANWFRQLAVRDLGPDGRGRETVYTLAYRFSRGDLALDLPQRAGVDTPVPGPVLGYTPYRSRRSGPWQCEVIEGRRGGRRLQVRSQPRTHLLWRECRPVEQELGETRTAYRPEGAYDLPTGFEDYDVRYLVRIGGIEQVTEEGGLIQASLPTPVWRPNVRYHPMLVARNPEGPYRYFRSWLLGEAQALASGAHELGVPLVWFPRARGGLAEALGRRQEAVLHAFRTAEPAPGRGTGPRFECVRVVTGVR